MENVLIAGCGDVGLALAELLLADGTPVRAIRRQPEQLPPGVTGFGLDLRDPRQLAALPGDVEVLVFAASADESNEVSYRSLYLDGLRNVLEVLVRKGAPLHRVVFTSSTSVYGQTSGEWVDESSATNPPGFSGHVMLEAERMVADWSAERGSIGFSVRFGGIYGSGRTRLIDLVRSRRATCGDGPPRFTNRIHIDDCAGVLHHLLRSESPASIWLGVDDDPAEQCTVYNWLAERLGVPPPSRAPWDPGSVRGAERSNKRCSNARLHAAGYRFRHPSFREGYAAMLEALVPREGSARGS